MGWLGRFRRATPGEAVAEEKEESAPPAQERSAPGVAALFDGVREDGSHAILDLGSSREATFRVYRRFARRIRFADLLGDPPGRKDWAEALPGLPAHLGASYDLVLAWNILDLLPPRDAPLLIRRLVQITSAGARLYVTVDASGSGTLQPLRFSLLEVGQVVQWAVGPPQAAHRELLPAEVERLLMPFQVRHAFTLRLGLREYVGVR